MTKADLIARIEGVKQKDHIEFFNPGGLPKPLEELKAKDISMPRNPVITKLFRMVKLAENAGFGLDKMDTHWQAYNQTTPEIIPAFDSTLMIFATKGNSRSPNTPLSLAEKWGERWEQHWAEIEAWWKQETGANLNKSEIKILDMMAALPEVSMLKLSETIGIVETAIGKNIKKLKDKEIIQRIGPAKGGHWKIIK